MILTFSIVFVNDQIEGDLGKDEQVYLGVAFCGNTTSEAIKLIDRVKGYTNLFVLQSGPVSENETLTTDICDYAVDAGLDIIVYFGDLGQRILEEKDMLWRISWVRNAEDRYKDKFLGIYLYDEPGGIYLDYNWTEADIIPRGASIDDLTYDSIANLYEYGFQVFDQGFRTAKTYSDRVFVSDYGLYWFDYLAGYDVVLSQVGWNHTLEQDIALVRGAARIQDKSWGSMLTWKYDEPPYLDSGEAVFDQMLISYECGAEYIVIFNYPTLEGNDFGVMTEEHFDALERFWYEIVQSTDYSQGSVVGDVALVLPKNYGWGLRHPQDRIWGWFGPDELSGQIWDLSRSLLSTHNYTLDIIYDDGLVLDNAYKEYIFWNGTNYSSSVEANVCLHLSDYNNDTISIFDDLNVKWVRTDWIIGSEMIDYSQTLQDTNVNLLAIIDINTLGNNFTLEQWNDTISEIVVSEGFNTVDAVEIWNEPNAGAYIEPEMYYEILKSAYVILKNYSDVEVVFAGVSPNIENWREYLTTIFAHDDAVNYFDVMGLHLYDDMSINFDTLQFVEGLSDKEIWVTETGYPSIESEELQANYVSSLYESIYPLVDKMFIYELLDNSGLSDPKENYFGLLTVNGSKKEAYYRVWEIGK